VFFFKSILSVGLSRLNCLALRLKKVNSRFSRNAKDYFYPSMVKKESISVILMVIAILVIVAFQAYWLRKSYREEEEALNVQANFIFRETVFELQGAKMKPDSGSHIRVPAGSGLSEMLNVLRVTARDSVTKRVQERRMFYSVEKRAKDEAEEEGDDAKPARIRSKDRIYDILLEVDSLQDTLTVKEIEHGFRKSLDKQKLPVAFTINRKNANRGPFPEFNEQRVTIGFRNPVSYGFELKDPTVYLYRRISSPLLFSFFLVGVTLLSFILLYRNLLQQRKLTALKNDFISNITHELKTPIATVSVAIEAMKNFKVLEDPEKSKEYLDISAEELQRLSLLVDKVLKLSLYEKKEIELKKESFSWKELVEQVISTLRLQIEKSHALVNFSPEGNDFLIHADKLHITSVVYNLLDNALKYSAAEPVISIHLKKQADQLQLSVSDNGIGIPAAFQEKIFEKFFRVPSGDKHNVKGYGLGLSYVAYVVKRHDGTVTVNSYINQGSTFIIKLPAANGKI
jgi:two-component system, OmpR family, phosphate regulon sensor histidine kinase PhoR